MPNWIMYPIPVYSSVKGNSISKIMARLFSKKMNPLIGLRLIDDLIVIQSLVRQRYLEIIIGYQMT